MDDDADSGASLSASTSARVEEDIAEESSLGDLDFFFLDLDLAFFVTVDTEAEQSSPNSDIAFTPTASKDVLLIFLSELISSQISTLSLEEAEGAGESILKVIESLALVSGITGVFKDDEAASIAANFAACAAAASFLFLASSSFLNSFSRALRSFFVKGRARVLSTDNEVEALSTGAGLCDSASKIGIDSTIAACDIVFSGDLFLLVEFALEFSSIFSVIFVVVIFFEFDFLVSLLRL